VIRRLHLEAPIPSICPAQPEVPDWVDAALTRAMAKRPEDRFPTAEEFGRALRHARP
jgi:serine/threonine-protein kinase